MAEALHLFHTASVHVARFDAIRDRIAAQYPLVHHIREDWLTRARRDGISDALRQEILQTIGNVGGPVLCTCTTLGEVAADAGAVRVDGPMMQAAALIGGRICLAYCLESTAEASVSILERSIGEFGTVARIDRLAMPDVWPHFEAGDTDAFDAAVADGVRNHLVQIPETACVVLAQASMEGASALLAQTGKPILSSPEMALRVCLGLRQGDFGGN